MSAATPSLAISDQQALIRDAAIPFLADNGGIAALRQARGAGGGVCADRQAWARMVELGWAGLIVPEDRGGIGLGGAEAGMIAEQMGRRLTLSPFISNAVGAAWTLLRGGSTAQQARYLPGIASGTAIIVPAIQETPVFRGAAAAATAQPGPSGLVLDGRKIFVPDAGCADAFLVLATIDGKRRFLLVDRTAQGVDVAPTTMLDGSDAGTVTFTNVALSGDSVLDGDDDLADAVPAVLNIMLSAELLGLCDEVFERTRDYLVTRTQFGHRIGSFQALQHRAATMFCELELCRSLVRAAIGALDDRTGAIAEIVPLAAQCKAKLADTARHVTNEAIQMHGGIGMTDECDIGLFVKRARVLRQLYGDYGHHYDQVARSRGY